MSSEIEVVISALLIVGILVWKNRRMKVKYDEGVRKRESQRPPEPEPPLSNAELKAMERWFSDDDGPSSSP
jgi:hypothetical protein